MMLRLCISYHARDALLTHRFARIKHAGHIHSPYGEKANEHYNITIKLLYCSRYLLTNYLNNEYMNDIYKTNI